MGTQYKLSISVENIVGEGEISDEITFTFANLPSVPQNIAITNSNNYFYISWNAPSSSNDDNNIVSGNAFSVVFSGSDLDFDVTNGITQLIQYEFKVSDINSENRECDFSNSAIFYAASVLFVVQFLV